MSIDWDEIVNYQPKKNFMYYFNKFVYRPLNTAKYWLRSHTYNRYHILDMRNPGYDWGWCDRDHLILSASFNILKEFVEKEYKGHFTLEIPEEAEEQDMVLYWTEYCYREHEIKELYDWWTKGRWADHKIFDDAGTKFTYEDMEALEDIDNANLQRLINIRQCLWT